MAKDKVREIRLRNWAARLGLVLHKSRARRWSIINHQGYVLIELSSNKIFNGEVYDLTLDDVENILEQYEAKLRNK